MSDKIHVQRVSPFGTNEWRAVRSDGDPLFEIRLQISSMLNGSRYFNRPTAPIHRGSAR